jgi:hypothetical protein
LGQDSRGRSQRHRMRDELAELRGGTSRMSSEAGEDDRKSFLQGWRRRGRGRLAVPGWRRSAAALGLSGGGWGFGGNERGREKMGWA